MIETKYGFAVNLEFNIDRLTNQLWKLIPMREHEENWQAQLETVILEIAGLNEAISHKGNLIILLSKLEGLLTLETTFPTYRKTIFEAISLVREMQS